MKKFIAVILTLALCISCFAACTTGTETSDPTKEPATETEAPANINEKCEGALTYAEYAALSTESETQIVIEAYVQAKQSWWDNKATVYTMDGDGAYFIYNMVCSEEDYAKLVPGTKIRVTGYKTAWKGEVEIAEGATFEFCDTTVKYIAPAVDVTAKLGTDDLINFQNQYVSFKGLTVVASQDADGNDVAFLYNWDGSGDHASNSDLYFKVSDGTNTYQFTVESYLTNKDTDVYAAVEALKVGDKVDLEGFLYWYNGVNPHITKVSK